MTSTFNAHGKIVKAILVTVMIAVVIAVIAAPAPAQNTPYSNPVANIDDGQWHVEFVPVPSVLRIHVPGLPGEGGMLVQSIEPGSDAARMGLHVGDVLLEVNGIFMNSPADLPRLDQNTTAVSLHRGQISTIRMPYVSICPPIYPSTGVSASSFANGNESVAVRSIGDQHAIEMALPRLTDAMIRVQGTRSQIEKKILDAGLSPATKQRVLSAMGGIR